MSAMKVQHCAKSMQFFVNMPGNKRAILDYTLKNGNTMNMTHTFVPPEVRGQKVAEQIVKEAFHYARINDYHVIPSCSYIAKYVENFATPEEKKTVIGKPRL